MYQLYMMAKAPLYVPDRTYTCPLLLPQPLLLPPEVARPPLHRGSVSEAFVPNVTRQYMLVEGERIDEPCISHTVHGRKRNASIRDFEVGLVLEVELAI